MSKLKISNFDLQPEHIVEQLGSLLKNNQAEIMRLCEQEQPSWQNLIAPIEKLDNTLSQFFSPLNHLNSVCNTDALREAYNSCLPLLSEYSTDLGQSKPLLAAYQKVKDSVGFTHLSVAQQKIINNALRDFTLSGINLPAKKQLRYKAISARISELTTKFEENILDSVNAWQKQISDVAELQGMPAHRIQLAQEAAQAQGMEGYLLTLDFPCYYDVVTFSDSAVLREELYQAYTTRASDQSALFAQYDNQPIINELLALRDEKSKLLGYENYAELSLVCKMADTPAQVDNFLNSLIKKVKEPAKQDLKQLENFAGCELQPWDTSYYSEKLRQERYAISQEEIKPYFPVNHVLEALFNISNKLFSIHLKDITDTLRPAQTWHKDVRFYEIYDANDKLTGGIYMDFFARKNKRGGAWMNDVVGRFKQANGKIQLPIAFLTCNFSPATSNKPALLTHDDVVTLFHEFGHCLQHLLTQIDYLDVSGINGVAWDAVEFPSQFMEAWCWQPESLQLLSSHVDTGESLPLDMIEKLVAAKNFQAGLFLLRQLEFALFDITLYSQYNPQQDYVQQTLNTIRQDVAVMQPPQYNRFQNSFSHIFAGGYSAGYYSYLWAELLARDAFSAFKGELGQRFKETVLGLGGSLEPEVVFEKFMGRSPDSEALLGYYGL